MLLLLVGDISLNPGPTPNRFFQSFWKPFENKGLYCLHLNINSILPKLDELNKIAGNTKAAIIGKTESKVGGSISDSEVEIPGYWILRCDRNRNGGGVASYIRQDLCFNLRSTAMGDIEEIFFDILLPKTKPIFIENLQPVLISGNVLINMTSALKMKYFCLGISIKIFFIMANIFSKKTKPCKIVYLVQV